jgi:hypothetical protein
LRHDRVAVLQTLEHFRSVFVELWISLTWNEKAIAIAVALPASFYLAKNSDSYIVNTVAALFGLVLVAYLIILMFS